MFSIIIKFRLHLCKRDCVDNVDANMLSKNDFRVQYERYESVNIRAKKFLIKIVCERLQQIECLKRSEAICHLIRNFFYNSRYRVVRIVLCFFVDYVSSNFIETRALIIEIFVACLRFLLIREIELAFQKQQLFSILYDSRDRLLLLIKIFDELTRLIRLIRVSRILRKFLTILKLLKSEAINKQIEIVVLSIILFKESLLTNLTIITIVTKINRAAISTLTSYLVLYFCFKIQIIKKLTNSYFRCRL